MFSLANGTIFESPDIIAQAAKKAGMTAQNVSAIAIGFQAGLTSQGKQSIAIGKEAGSFKSGSNSISLGAYANATNNNTILLNATGTPINTTNDDGFFCCTSESVC